MIYGIALELLRNGVQFEATKKGSQEFLDDCINHFKNRKFNKRVPDFLREQEDNLNTLRNLSRTILRGNSIIKNVKSGVFPGKY